MFSSWPGRKQLRDFLHRNDPKPDVAPTYTLTLDVAELGTKERAQQFHALRQEMHQLEIEAADAYKSKLRPVVLSQAVGAE